MFRPLYTVSTNNGENDVLSTLAGRWDQECRFGCGYIHLNCATKNMLSNCCFNGKLSPLNDSDIYYRFGHLKSLSADMQNLMINNIQHYGKLSSTYNNILSISASGVTNGHPMSNVTNTHPGGFERRVGDHSVTMQGRMFHYFPKARNTSDASGKYSKFTYLNNFFINNLLLFRWNIIFCFR